MPVNVEDFNIWKEWKEANKFKYSISETFLGQYRVLTVYDIFSQAEEEGVNSGLYETYVLGGFSGGLQETYTSEEDAVLGHEEIVDRLENLVMLN